MRPHQLEQFLELSNWQMASRLLLAGDASPRRYQRLTAQDGTTRILMDAPPERCGTLEPFLNAAAHLADLGFSTPIIMAVEPAAGFILMEDLGDAIYARVIEDNPSSETELYNCAIESLAALHTHQAPTSIPPYSPKLQAELASLSLEWYSYFAINEKANPEIIDAFHDTMAGLIAELTGPVVFTHRDFHAENLIWLPERSGIRRVGLLDFQDAMQSHPAYDLVSLVEDARRDISNHLRQTCVQNYCDLSGFCEETMNHSLAVCGAQRNLRILGVFARLAIRDRKLGYLKFIPRVWNHLQRDLSHPALNILQDIVTLSIPPPTNSVLAKLEQAPA